LFKVYTNIMILRWFTDRNIHTDEPLKEYNIIKTADMKYS